MKPYTKFVFLAVALFAAMANVGRTGPGWLATGWHAMILDHFVKSGPSRPLLGPKRPQSEKNKLCFGIPHPIAKGHTTNNRQQTPNIKHQTREGVTYVRGVGVGVQIGQPGEGGLPM